MNRMVPTDNGIVTRVTRASSHETTNIMMRVPTRVRTEMSIWLNVCWRL